MTGIINEQPGPGSKIIEIASKEIGTTEDPPNSNRVKYNTWFYGKEVSGPNYPWCGTYVSYVYDKAGMPLGNIGYTKGFAGCPTAVSTISKWGREVTIPEAGDIAFFDWDGDKKWDHVGLFVTEIGNGIFSTVEGNTSLGNDSNGGKVMPRQRRHIADRVKFVRPNSKK